MVFFIIENETWPQLLPWTFTMQVQLLLTSIVFLHDVEKIVLKGPVSFVLYLKILSANKTKFKISFYCFKLKRTSRRLLYFGPA